MEGALAVPHPRAAGPRRATGAGAPTTPTAKDERTLCCMPHLELGRDYIKLARMSSVVAPRSCAWRNVVGPSAVHGCREVKGPRVGAPNFEPMEPQGATDRRVEQSARYRQAGART